jgi:hypothetical protein
VLSDQEADEIRRGLEGGTRGPILIKWVRLLLADRDERREKERRAEGKDRYRLGPDGGGSRA